jgi:colanic acid biosynthesis glycosyl transferase WcaI
MAAGRPVLAAVDKISDVTTLVADAGCGIAVEADNPPALAAAVRRLHADPHDRTRMGRRGRDYVVQHHSPAVVAGRYQQLLRGLTGISAPSHPTSARMPT